MNKPIASSLTWKSAAIIPIVTMIPIDPSVGISKIANLTWTQPIVKMIMNWIANTAKYTSNVFRSLPKLGVSTSNLNPNASQPYAFGMILACSRNVKSITKLIANFSMKKPATMEHSAFYQSVIKALLHGSARMMLMARLNVHSMN